jgi:DNA-binding CsgD family transcriptional regulator
VDEIAEALDVGVATVRTHVQRLLAKTGTRRQSELVRLLVSGPWLGS